MTRSTRMALLVIVLVAALVTAVHAPAAAAADLSGNKPWVVVLCKFEDEPAEPRTVEYYERLFTEAGAGQGGGYDYWRDVSYGALDVSGTVVKGWYELPMRRLEFNGLNRYNATRVCAEAAADDVDYSDYWGVIAVNNQPIDEHDPSGTTMLTAAVDDTETTFTVASSDGFPEPPFPAFVGNGDPYNGEEINITAVDGDEWTVVRGYEGRPITEHPAGAVITQPTTAHYGGSGLGQVDTPIGDEVFPLGLVILSEDANMTGGMHEMGHGFGYPHSRKLSTSIKDYCALYDLMSAGCVYPFEGNFGGSNLGGPVAAAGPGITSIFLDRMGWLPPSRSLEFDNSTCRNQTIPLAALNHPDRIGSLEVRVPAAIPIATPDGDDQGEDPDTTTSEYYSVEYRSKSGWDRGIPQDAIVLHLKGQDDYPYWVDHAGSGGALTAGAEFVDADHDTFIGVNRIDSSAFSAQVTLGSCPIPTDIAYDGDTQGDFGDDVTLAVDLTVANPTAAPLPGEPVTLRLGNQSCQATTDSAGQAACTIRLDQVPGSYALSASFPGTDAYEPASRASSFTISRRATATTLGSSPNPSVAGQPVSFTATVTVAAGAGTATGTITFRDGTTALGTAVVGSDGRATFTDDQLAVGGHQLTAVYSGDTRSEPSTSPAVSQRVDKGSTATTLASSDASPVFTEPVTFTATVTPVAPAAGAPGGTVTFTDGATTIGSATVDGVGRASVTTSALTAGVHTVLASYSGDGNFVASAASVTQQVAKASTHLDVDEPEFHLDLRNLLWVRFSARLTVVATDTPMAGRTVLMTVGSTTLCSTTTDADGIATCDRRLGGVLSVLLHGGYTAVFVGDTNLLATSTRSPR